MTLTTGQRAAVQPLRRVGTVPAPPTVARLFSVWMAADIPAHYTSIAQMCAAAAALAPAGQWDGVELLLKAGEGGSWQSNFDTHQLAISGPLDLLGAVQLGLSAGVRIIPYVNVRARAEWVADEQRMIRQCVQVAGRCVLNVEPGSAFYNGPLDPGFIRGYLAGIGVAPTGLESCMIPRSTQVGELGGPACLQAWTDPTLVGRASWETYCSLTASLCPDVAIPQLDGWGVPQEPQHRVCVVQRTDISDWADTVWCAQGCEVWWLDSAL